MRWWMGRVLALFAGFRAIRRAEDMWELADSTWSPRLVDGAWPGGLVSLAYHGPEHRFLAFGGYDMLGSASDQTWALASRAPLEVRELCTVATFDDDGDGLAGCADPDCCPQCSPICPPSASCPTDAPRCGDDECALGVESFALCPADCS